MTSAEKEESTEIKMSDYQTVKVTHTQTNQHTHTQFQLCVSGLNIFWQVMSVCNHPSSQLCSLICFQRKRVCGRFCVAAADSEALWHACSRLMTLTALMALTRNSSDGQQTPFTGSHHLKHQLKPETQRQRVSLRKTIKHSTSLALSEIHNSI